MEAQPLVKLECCISFGNCNLIGNIKGAFLEGGNSCSMFQSGIFIKISIKYIWRYKCGFLLLDHFYTEKVSN